MRTTLMGLAFVGVLSVVGYRAADAMTMDAAAMNQAAVSASSVQKADYLRRTRHGVVRCYWDFGWGRTICHRYHGYYGYYGYPGWGRGWGWGWWW